MLSTFLVDLLIIGSCFNNIYLFANAQLYSCANRPCQNGGTCIDQPNSFYGYNCICTSQYYGINCQLLKSGGNPIVGGGNINLNPNGGGGININPNGININPNGVGGISINNPNPNINPNQFPNSGGSISINNGGNQFCLNGGKFVQNGLPCICPSGYSGSRCETKGLFNNIIGNFCFSSPCYNNGICKSTFNGYTCQCLSNYYGQRCEYIRTYGQNSSKILGISLGSILPTLFFICLIGLCVYCCCFKKRNSSNGGGGVILGLPGSGPAAPPNFGNYAFQNQQPYMQQQQQQQRQQFPDPDQVFKVNQAPPSYEEVQTRKL